MSVVVVLLPAWKWDKRDVPWGELCAAVPNRGEDDDVLLRTELAGLLGAEDRGDEIPFPRTRPLRRPCRFFARREETGELTLGRRSALEMVVVVVVVVVPLLSKMVSLPKAPRALLLSKVCGRFFFFL